MVLGVGIGPGVGTGVGSGVGSGVGASVGSGGSDVGFEISALAVKIATAAWGHSGGHLWTKEPAIATSVTSATLNFFTCSLRPSYRCGDQGVTCRRHGRLSLALRKKVV